MIVGVRYLAQLKQAAGRAVEQVSIDARCTVAELAGLLAERHVALRSSLLDAAGQVQPTLLIFVGDEQAEPGRLLRDGDEVTLMTPIAGGEVEAWQAGGR
jgi:molybdopterin converting factor small subunit